jgi:septum formation protein
MLERLSGRGHKVLTGVALHGARGTQTVLSETDVYFREISRDEALAYWQSGEPCDKAGAYAVQGLGGVFVERIEGSYSGVVGLPVFETATLLSNAGLGVVTRQ